MKHLALALCILLAFSCYQRPDPEKEKKRVQAMKLEVLKEKMAGPNPEDRALAALALGKLGPAAVPLLLRALGDPNPVVSDEARKSFAKLGPQAQGAIPRLIQYTGHSKKHVRRMAASSLISIGPAVITPVYDEMIQSGPMESRTLLAYTLGRLGSSALDRLVEASTSPREEVRFLAAIGLFHVGPPAVETLVKMLGDSSVKVRHIAVLSLADMKFPQKEQKRYQKILLDAFRPLLKDPSPKVVEPVLNWWKKNGPK